MSILDTAKYATLAGETPRKWERALEEYLLSDLKKEAKNYV